MWEAGEDNSTMDLMMIARMGLNEKNDVQGRHAAPLELRDRFCSLIHHLLEGFVASNQGRLKLQKNLSLEQKHYLLTAMQCMGLRVKFNQDMDSYLTKGHSYAPFVRPLVLSPESRLILETRSKLIDGRDVDYRKEKLKTLSYRAVGVLTGGSPRIPRPPLSNRFQAHRESLPIYQHREEILNLIAKNAVCVIKGPAGCGKSTQIPQYILEEAERTRSPVRILVASPNNVSVVALCERVAAERGEAIGLSVGYQIPLESNSSPVETLLNFVSIPIFIRAMAMPGCQLLDTTTHVLVDEVHLRTRYQDFLLLCLRDALLTRSHLKIVIMSEEYNVHSIVDYFDGERYCPQLTVNFTKHEPRVYHLEDILPLHWRGSRGGRLNGESVTDEAERARKHEENATRYNVDSMIESAFKGRNAQSAYEDFWNLARTREIPIDYQHSATAITMLMAAAAGSRLDVVRILVEAGAKISLLSKNGYTAIDWAEKVDATEVKDYLTKTLQYHSAPLSPAEKITLDYIRQYDPQKPDLTLICDLIRRIHFTDKQGGGILVFVMTYENIMELKELICTSYSAHAEEWTDKPLYIYFLHEYIQSGDQRAVFEHPEEGCRKIVLSTYLGESCFSFRDIQFVIDSGKSVRAEAVYSSLFSPTLSMPNGRWISKAEADCRRDRVSHAPGSVCYRLYTRQCYEEMEPCPRPEIMDSPLLELCLQSRSLLRNDIGIAELFSELPQPPQSKDVEAAVNTLKVIGALEGDEQLADLGVHLLEYNIDPKWAKAVILSVIFKCMDPVLTIASCASYGEPFAFSGHPEQREISRRKKAALSYGTFSDHVALIKAFEQWEEEKAGRTDPGRSEFCAKNSVSQYTFDVVYSIRTHLLGQLRAAGFVQTKGTSDVIDTNKYAKNWAVVKAVLTASLYPNIAVINRVSQNLFDRESSEVQFSELSVLGIEKPDWYQGIPSDWIIYEEKMPTPGDITEIQGCSVVSPIAVALFAGDVVVEPEHRYLAPPPLVQGTGFVFSAQERTKMMNELRTNGFLYNVDDWIRFFGFDPLAEKITGVRESLMNMMKRHLRNPECAPLDAEDEALEAVVKILSAEDARLGLKQAKVGQWPKLVAGNLLSTSLTGFEVCRSNGA